MGVPERLVCPSVCSSLPLRSLQLTRFKYFHQPPTIHPCICSGNSFTMSWQAYVDEHLMCDIDGTGHRLSSAAILGAGGVVWAKSANFPTFKPEEITAIRMDFDEPGYLAPTGLFVAGEKYMVIQGEPGAVIRGKKGSGGITIKKTGQAMIFGIYEEPVTPGQCNVVVERLADYLIDQGM